MSEGMMCCVCCVCVSLVLRSRGMSSSSRPERWRFAEMKRMMDVEFAFGDMPRPFDLTVAAVDGKRERRQHRVIDTPPDRLTTAHLHTHTNSGLDMSTKTRG